MSYQRFQLPSEYQFNQSNPLKWVIHHIFKYKYIAIIFVILIILGDVLHSLRDWLIGIAFTVVQQGAFSNLIIVTLILLVSALISELCSISSGLLAALLSQRCARDARNELYLSLLGKSQTFHDHQNVGDIVARASNDVDKLSEMILPGVFVILQAYGGLLISFIFIAMLNPQLLIIPISYTVCLFFTLGPFQKQLFKSFQKLQGQFGEMNSVLTEAVNGIEVIKATSQEEQEGQKFFKKALQYRDAYEKNGLIQGRYIPTLLLGLFLILAFLHSLYLLLQGVITLGTLIAFMVLAVENLRYVTETSLYDVSLIPAGLAGAKRILDIMKEEPEPDENEQGYNVNIEGDIIFDQVSFNYGNAPILKNISFHAKPGQTVAIVGQTGSGKTTLTKLINRIYKASSGHVLIDGVDVQKWDLGALRSQIATIEQDIFLFSQSIAENIDYGSTERSNQEAIESAAKEAQAHDFIVNFQKGYSTVIGDRGITLSGGQRQRIAIARALLNNPKMIIFDDATSAVDSKTEDEIQKSINRLLQGRTTFLITHSLSQIRRADLTLVMQEGELIDQGTHDQLIERCNIYSQIFLHTDNIG